MRSTVFLAFTLKLLSVTATRSVFWRVTQFQQTSTPREQILPFPGELPGSFFFTVQN